eukprot:4411404-Alexandrium_andersonii.AAC.1
MHARIHAFARVRAHMHAGMRHALGRHAAPCTSFSCPPPGSSLMRSTCSAFTALAAELPVTADHPRC